jgi:lipopolysaccharide transport system permease protein
MANAEISGLSAHQSITVLSPNDRSRVGFIGGWIKMILNVIASRELIIVLFKRDFFASYRKSFLGMTWLFIAPIVGVVSWIFMNATGILQPGPTDVPYPAFVLLGSTIWGLFIGVYASAAGTLGAGSGFIMQIKYPHEALLVKQLAQTLASFAINFIIILVVLAILGVRPSWTVVFFPLLVLPLLLLGSGIGLFVSVINVVAPEVQKVVDILMGLLIWITPVIFSQQSKNPLLSTIMEWNPLTYLVGGVRDVVFHGQMEHWDRFGICSALSLAVFLLFWRLFYISEPYVIEKMI